MDQQQILQLIYRNQQQIDLLTQNNTQLIQALLEQGAQAAIAALTVKRVSQRGRPRKEVPPQMADEQAPVRVDSLGRKIPSGGRWTPARRAAQSKRMSERMREQHRQNAKNKPHANTGWMVRKTPKQLAAWKAKLSAANLAARERKAAAGVDYTTGKPLNGLAAR
jgi:hypothetical protein